MSKLPGHPDNGYIAGQHVETPPPTPTQVVDDIQACVEEVRAMSRPPDMVWWCDYCHKFLVEKEHPMFEHVRPCARAAANRLLEEEHACMLVNQLK